MLAPAARDPQDDDFPLSTYPMFARARPAELRVTRAVSVLSDGTRSAVAPRLVANTEPMQALSTLARAAREGPEAIARLCRGIASRLPEPREVELEELRVEPAAWLAGAPPRERRVLARCGPDPED